MKVVCLTRYAEFCPKGTLVLRLQQEFVAHGHTYILLNPDTVNTPTGQILLKEADFLDTVLPSSDVTGWQVVEHLETWAKPFIKGTRLPAGDKVTMAHVFAQAQVPIPLTYVAKNAYDALEKAKNLGYPCIGKTRHGQGGQGVFMLEDAGDVETFVAHAHTIAPNFVLQEAVFPTGEDYRLFVVGDAVVAAMRRVAPAGEFRTNLSLAGQGEAYTPHPEEERVALAACRAYGVPFAGVDVMRKGGLTPVVIELNRAPDLRLTEPITGVNIAAKIVAYWEGIYAKRQRG